MPVNEDLLVACPSCGSMLVANDLAAGGTAICARCRRAFLYQPLGDTRRVSRKAVAALSLSVASLLFLCFTATPALILSGLALADIYRHADRLRGRGLAITAIVLSVVFSFLSLVVWALLLPALQTLRAPQT